MCKAIKDKATDKRVHRNSVENISSVWKALQSQINITQLSKQSSVIQIKDQIIIFF